MTTSAGATGGAPATSDVSRAALAGLAAAAGVGLVWTVLSAVLSIHLGLLAVAAVGGWAIGASVARFARGRRALATALAIVAWLVGSVLAYVVRLALAPHPATPLAELLTIENFVEYTMQTFDLVGAASIAILVAVAWRSAR